MSELEDKITNILSNPDELAKITNMARSLMDGGSFLSNSDSENGENSLSPMLKNMMSNMGSMGDISSLLGGEISESKPNKTAILEAICPYLEKSRGDKLAKAIRLAKMAKVAKIFMKESGGGDSGDK